MKKIIKSFILNFVFISFTSCSGAGIISTESNVVKGDIKSKAEKLKEYYSKSISGDEKEKYQKLFFYQFPSQFLQLDSLYGYSDTYTGVLSDFAIEHIADLFNKISCVPENDYFDKIISIAINGHWESDGINYFSHGLREHAFQNPTLVFKLLENRNENEIKSFWYFFFDGPHPDETIPREFDSMKIINPRIYSLMEDSQKKVLKNHGH